MRDTITEHNKAHYEALAVVENFIANGGKVKQCKTVERDPWACTINPKSVRHVDKKLLSMTPMERFKVVIKKHGQLSRQEIVSYTGTPQTEVSRISGILAKEGYIKKVVLNKSALNGKQVIYSYNGK